MSAVMSHAERAHEWSKMAVLHYEMGRQDDAEVAAEEAGRYGMEMPAAIAQYNLLKLHFERGAACAVQDAEDEARADAIAEAGFDPF